ncbi:MAG: hypothetical protein QOG64_2313 [Acidimicrobiaceae bacterium]|jgi:flavin reductase (DIM6/NTAB) family NADH-FMN oxidoreductase RutF|nr:hypothetical protein [Acidimicrobiaceae bacterium]
MLLPMSEVGETFQSLVAWLDYPMLIVTTAAGQQRAGCLVGFATQCSIDPPRLLVCLSKKNFTFRVAERAGLLAVHFLTRAHTEVSKLFGERTGDEVDKFDSCAWTAGPEGVPLLDDCAGYVVGRILNRVDAGDHVAHILEPVAAERRDGGDGQLSFQQVKDMEPGHAA